MRFPARSITLKDGRACVLRPTAPEDSEAMIAYMKQTAAETPYLLRYPDEDRRHVRFGFILIDPARRGQGLGRQMLELAIRYAREFLKAEDVCLGVYSNNPGAVALYKKLGFRDTGEVEESHYMGETWYCREMLMKL